MNFIEWLKQFAEQQNAIGDLARDALRDTEPPAVNRWKAWRLHLEDRNACDAAIDTFERAWARYLQEVRP